MLNPALRRKSSGRVGYPAGPDARRPQQERLLLNASHGLRTRLASRGRGIQECRAADACGEVSPCPARETSPLGPWTGSGKFGTPQAGLVITASITPSPVLGDAHLLERLVSNLVDNAICCNVTKGRLDIQVSTAGGVPTLKVTNTGPVVPTSQVNRLFEPFQRLRTDEDLGDQGLGLGLSIVAAIAKARSRHPHGSARSARGSRDLISFPPGASITTAWERSCVKGALTGNSHNVFKCWVTSEP